MVSKQVRGTILLQRTSYLRPRARLLYTSLIDEMILFLKRKLHIEILLFLYGALRGHGEKNENFLRAHKKLSRAHLKSTRCPLNNILCAHVKLSLAHVISHLHVIASRAHVITITCARNNYYAISPFRPVHPKMRPSCLCAPACSWALMTQHHLGQPPTSCVEIHKLLQDGRILKNSVFRRRLIHIEKCNATKKDLRKKTPAYKFSYLMVISEQHTIGKYIQVSQTWFQVEWPWLWPYGVTRGQIWWWSWAPYTWFPIRINSNILHKFLCKLYACEMWMPRF